MNKTVNYSKAQQKLALVASLLTRRVPHLAAHFSLHTSRDTHLVPRAIH